MAKLYSCDRCRTQIEAEEADRREWTGVHLTKIDGQAAFQKADLCVRCTNLLRLFLQGATVSEVYTDVELPVTPPNTNSALLEEDPF